VSDSLFKALRICEAATLVEVFSNACIISHWLVVVIPILSVVCGVEEVQPGVWPFAAEMEMVAPMDLPCERKTSP
jgi:hypothetical protein